ncbi:hypothetical protein, partial [Rhizobium sp. AC27/96]|uniref:hypothetical protein n=1 Tax=Rhizobium sp. AC27/96 TaxID=1841653 RepID=UPI001A7E06B3
CAEARGSKTHSPPSKKAKTGGRAENQSSFSTISAKCGHRGISTIVKHACCHVESWKIAIVA